MGKSAFCVAFNEYTHRHTHTNTFPPVLFISRLLSIQNIVFINNDDGDDDDDYNEEWCYEIVR